MSELLAGGDAVTHALFEFLHFGKAALYAARPERFATGSDFKDPTGSGEQGQLSDFVLEREEQFLGHPRGTEEPAALSAVFNLDTRRFWHQRAAVLSP
jgi:hypothetical protein